MKESRHSSEVTVGRFGPFVSFCPELAPATHVGSYLQSYTVFLYFVAQGEVCPSASTAAKDPGSQPVSTARNEQLSKQRMWG